jgi:hypothetical protein
MEIVVLFAVLDGGRGASLGRDFVRRFVDSSPDADADTA